MEYHVDFFPERKPLAITPSGSRVCVVSYHNGEYGILWLPVSEWRRCVERRVPYFPEQQTPEALLDGVPVKTPQWMTIVKYLIRGEQKFAWKLVKEKFGVNSLGG